MLYKERLLNQANHSWHSAVERHPDLVSPVELQRQLISRQLDLGDALNKSAPVRIEIGINRSTDKLLSETPLLLDEPLVIDLDLTPFVVGFCDDLAQGEAGGAARRLAELFSRRTIDVGSLVAASIGRQQGAIRTKANHVGVSADLLWLVAELAAGSLAHRAQRELLSRTSEEVMNEALAAWRLGYCPMCGSWPAFVEHMTADDVAAHRCSFCGHSWSPPRSGCAYCDDAPDPLMTAVADDSRLDRRVDLCRNCAGYLKHFDLDGPTPFELLAVEDLCSSDLDIAASEKGYRRPGMRDFPDRDL